MSVHISVYILYTVCNRRYTGRYVEGVYTEFFSCGRILICQYTFKYTSCILRVTGGILGGTWKVCIRNFIVVVDFLLVQATCQSVYSMYTGRIMGYSECGVEGMCSDFVYLRFENAL